MSWGSILSTYTHTQFTTTDNKQEPAAEEDDRTEWKKWQVFVFTGDGRISK